MEGRSMTSSDYTSGNVVVGSNSVHPSAFYVGCGSRELHLASLLLLVQPPQIRVHDN
jgi:hypothetical protein